MRVALNGIDYTAENEHCLFTFIGTATVFKYWPYIIAILLGLLVLIGLVLCCSLLLTRLSQIEMKRGPEGRRPYVLRDDLGFVRHRGYFAEKESPMPGQKSIGGGGSQMERGPSYSPSQYHK